VCSRALFAFFNDPEGPNLLIIIVLAAIIYFLSLAFYLYCLPKRQAGLKKLLFAILIQILLVIGLFFLGHKQPVPPLDSNPHNVTLSGTYVCLPHLNTNGPQTEECAFGLQTDEGVYYAVNFGASANSFNQFQSRKHIKAEGFVVIKEALSSDHWTKYNMKGIFTVTKIIE
jgi:hypothetical protein